MTTNSAELKQAALPFAILAEEMDALERFHSCAEDGEGYDVPKAMMKRLEEIGLVRRRSGSYYEETIFGLSVLNGDFAGRTAAQGDQSNYAELEREHLGDPDKRTGIYHPDAKQSFPVHEQIKSILLGIDQDEADSEHGWWETSEGAAFGAEKLQQVLEVVGRMEEMLSRLEHRTGLFIPRGQAIDKSHYPALFSALEASADQAEFKLPDLRGQFPASEWIPITKPGQVKAGDKLYFTIGDENYFVTAREILNPGTDKEEIIYNKRKNYYLITSMAINNTGSQKNVKLLSHPMNTVQESQP